MFLNMFLKRMLITRQTVPKDLLSLDHKSFYSVYLIIFLEKPAVNILTFSNYILKALEQANS